MAHEADLIVLARVVRPDADESVADALAIRDGLVVAVGDRAEVLATRTRATEIVDLGDRCVLPGFVEPHTHPDLCARMYQWVDVSGFNHATAQDVERSLRTARDVATPGSWVFAFGLDPMLTPDLGRWGRDRLDALFPDNPAVVMLQTMHTVFVNSLALREAGIADNAPDPAGGGRFGRDADGRLDGVMKEGAAYAPFMRFLRESDESIRAGLDAQYDRYRAVGITSLGIAGSFGTARQDALLRACAQTAPARTVEYVRAPNRDQLRREPSGRHRFGGIKVWYDGSPYTGTMLLDEPYLDSQLCCCTLGIEPGTVGHANVTPDELLGTLVEMAEGGWQVLTHAQGDRGCREILDVYADAIAQVGGAHRWRLEHCALISEADLVRSAALGVSPSFHVDHIRFYGPELRDSIIGPERAHNLMPVCTALDHGHRVSLHADSPMYPPGPLRLARTAVTRLTRTDEVIGAHNAISVSAALRAITIDAAWQLGLDDEVGALTPGRRADLVVLETDPFAVAPRDLDRVEVVQTWRAGLTVCSGRQRRR